MSVIQNFIDRQIGINSSFNYDNILERLVVTAEDCYYGLLSSNAYPDEDPPIFACRFAEASGFEHMVAIANEDGRVLLRDTNRVTGGPLCSTICHKNAVFDLAWMPAAMKFVTVSGDDVVRLWDVQEGVPKPMATFMSHTRSVKTAAFRPLDPTVFATGARDGHILIWDIRVNHSSVVRKPDNCLMNCHSRFTPKTPGSHSKRARPDSVRATSITGLIFQDESTLISCGECDGNIKVWDLRKTYSINKQPLPKHSIPYSGGSTKNGYTNLIIDDAHMRLYASCMDSVIYCYNISTYNTLPERKYIGHENNTYYIKTSLSPDSKYLVSGSSDKNAYIWNVKYPEPTARLVAHNAEVTCVAWCQKGETKIVTCGDDARHKVWRIGKEFYTAEERLELRGNAQAIPAAEITKLRNYSAIDKTPISAKRARITTPNSITANKQHIEKQTNKKSRKCLLDLMNAVKEEEPTSKRRKLNLEGNSEPMADAHNFNIDAVTSSSFNKRLREIDKENLEESHPLTYSPKPGTSFMTPTKNYETPSPKKLKLTPIKEHLSPTTRIITFATPTENLPNFVQDGEAPHLRFMSPVKKKGEKTNWLERIIKEKKERKGNDRSTTVLPPSPKDVTPHRRNSASERPAKPNANQTLLKYFNVTTKDKR